MVSKTSDYALKTKADDTFGTLTYKMQQLKRQIQAERVVSIKEKLNNNVKKLGNYASQLMLMVTSRNGLSSMENRGLGKLLSSRIENPLCTISGPLQLAGDKDCVNCPEVTFPISAKLPSIEKIPPYTTWIFLDKNQRMAEDQSVVRRRRIYYDQHGSEALICSDSEEEIAEPEDEKHEFSEGEDRIIWMAFQENASDVPVEEMINILTQFVGGSSSEIQERYSLLKQKDEEKHNQNFEVTRKQEYERSTLLDRSLTAALDSFDNLFCRRCLVFDCRLHRCSQSLIYSSEKQFYLSDSDEERKPCSDQCYLRINITKDVLEGSALDTLQGTENKTLNEEDQNQVPLNAENPGKRKILNQTEDSMLVSADPPGFPSKRPKKFSDPDAADALSENVDTQYGDETHLTTQATFNSLSEHPSYEFNHPPADHRLVIEEARDGKESIIQVPVPELSSDHKARQVRVESSSGLWKPLEKELCLKGIEIFGKNSCLIARNLLAGLKTCMEVSCYMYEGVAAIPQRTDTTESLFSDAIGKVDSDHMDQEMPTRSRLLRRRGRARKLKYSWKSAGHPSMWRRIADGKNQSCKQYTPCGCQSMCGKRCPCLDNGTCCEKYCGCSKSCKNRFRGCHCAKSQCRSRQCPCFAAGRECDPDVCRNCWVSCGDGTLGEPPRQGDSQCGNMRLLLRQQQRILLAKSDVAGWGAFLKNAVNKNDYLGEYTGELISHREADKRGKIYDRANSSFLFDLNDQYVLDAYRKGDKLKFANHSSNPNCYAKVMLVAGDHRVGIFANEHIEASQELFYDYRYGPEQAPAWARKPEGLKGDDLSNSQNRAKKYQSH